MAEEQGEDLVSKPDPEDEDEEMQSGDDGNGFFVSEFHLSEEEYNFSQDVVDKKAEIELRKARFRKSKEFGPANLLHGKVSILTQKSDLWQFQAVALKPMCLPLIIAKKNKETLDQLADSKIIDQHKFDLLLLTYKTLDAKQTIIDEMNLRLPQCSKKSIERLLKEITVREKRDGDERIAYHATLEQWAELSLGQ